MATTKELPPRKVGDSISWTVTHTRGGAPLNLTPWTIECVMRTVDAARTVVATLTVTKADQGTSPGVYTITLDDTSAIPPGRYALDVRRTNGTYSTSSQTMLLPLISEITERD